MPYIDVGSRWFCGRFSRKVPRKVIPEGRQILRKVLAEGFCGRLRERLFLFFGRDQPFLLQRVPRKVFAEGSAEGFCGRFS